VLFEASIKVVVLSIEHNKLNTSKIHGIQFLNLMFSRLQDMLPLTKN